MDSGKCLKSYKEVMVKAHPKSTDFVVKVKTADKSSKSFKMKSIYKNKSKSYKSSNSNKCRADNVALAEKSNKRSSGPSTPTSTVCCNKTESACSEQTGSVDTASGNKYSKTNHKSYKRRTKRKVKAIINQMISKKTKSISGKSVQSNSNGGSGGSNSNSRKVNSENKSSRRKHGKQKGQNKGHNRVTIRRKRKDIRCLRLFHIKCKSVFRTKLDTQNSNNDTMPYHWIQEDTNDIEPREDKDLDNAIEANANSKSTSSLIGASIIYKRLNLPSESDIKLETVGNKTESEEVEPMKNTSETSPPSPPPPVPVVDKTNTEIMPMGSIGNELIRCNTLFDTYSELDEGEKQC